VVNGALLQHSGFETVSVRGVQYEADDLKVRVWLAQDVPVFGIVKVDISGASEGRDLKLGMDFIPTQNPQNL